MKLIRIFLVFVIVLLSCSCNPYEIKIPTHDYGQNDNDNPGGEDTGSDTGVSDEYPVKYPESGVEKTKTLLTTGYFSETKVADGITHYQFNSKHDDVSGVYQNINVLEVDLNNDKYKISFKYVSSADSTSAVGKRYNAIAAVNATYEQVSTYNRINGVNHSEVSIRHDDTNLDNARRFWKHEAAIVSDGLRHIGMVYGGKGQTDLINGGLQAIRVYKSLKEKNVFSASPMLIDDYNPVGISFVPAAYDDFTEEDFKRSFHAEDYQRHQGIRSPRTAVALTADNDLLFVVVDGRFPDKAVGMSARELTRFLIKHFNPRWAANFDGGGSSTMYISGHGDPQNGVVNYPCDNSKWDHLGQRRVGTFFLVEVDE